MKNYYHILEVPQNANTVQITKAFRKKALKLHPDVNKSPEAEKAFIELFEAYQVLKDLKRRRLYDRLLADPKTLVRRKTRKRTNVYRAAAKGRQKAEQNAQKDTWWFRVRTFLELIWVIFRIVGEIVLIFQI